MCPNRVRFLFGGFLLLMLFKPGLCSKLVHQNVVQGEDDDGQSDQMAQHPDIKKQYDLRWSSVSIDDTFSIQMEGTNCTGNLACSTDKDCYKCFPNMENAFKEGMPTDIPHRPTCKGFTNITEDATTTAGHCTCGVGRCYSYSRDMVTNDVFFYCGPCGFVGASCETEYECTNSIAECRNGFCECIDDGTFYDMSTCKIPYYGEKMLTQMFISTIIIVVLCAILAYSYHRLSRSRRQYFRRFGSWRRNSVVRESPADDTPPTYDDVVEKVPSYQDALDMEKEKNSTGQDNLAFEDNESLPPPYEESNTQKATKASSAGISHAPENQPIRERSGDEQPIRGDNPSIQEDTSSASQSSATKSSELEHQPIEQPLKDALDSYKTEKKSTGQDNLAFEDNESLLPSYEENNTQQATEASSAGISDAPEKQPIREHSGDEQPIRGNNPSIQKKDTSSASQSSVTKSSELEH